MTEPTASNAHLALVTCSELPELDEPERGLRQALADRGVTTDIVVWDDPAVDWTAYTHVLIRSTWDYSTRHRLFTDWTYRVERHSVLFNPADVVAWNINKTYLARLEEQGLPIVQTIWLDPERHLSSRQINTRFPAFGDFVIKPTISAGSLDTGRYDSSDTAERMLAITHAKNLLSMGRKVMVQRYQKGVDAVGETGLIFIDGKFSHAVRKAAMLEGPFHAEDGHPGLYHPEQMSVCEATPAELELGERAVETLNKLFPQLAEPLLYTRVDLVPDDSGVPEILEVELIEPSLFFELGAGSLTRFVDALAARL